MGVVPSEDRTDNTMPITQIVTENLFFDYQTKYEERQMRLLQLIPY